MPDPLKAIQRTSAFRGAILTVSMRWVDRLIGLASTMILARLLVPEDFGLVAMAMVIVGLLDVLLDLGVASALIQNTRADAEDFHTAWTLRLLQSAATALLLVVSAPFAADYYNDDRVELIIQVVAITAFVGGFENIGTVSFQKNMEFGRDFRFFTLRRIAGVLFTIPAALLLQSYWALVLGSLLSRVAGVGLSYWMSSFRPRLSLARLSQIWWFSQWNLLLAVGNYLQNAFGRFIVGRRADAATVGAYSVGEEIAMLPTTELLAPLGRVMFPVFAIAKHDPAELLRVVSLSLSVQALMAIPAGIGLALVAEDAIPLLLGWNWMSAVPYVQIIALASIATTLSHSGTYMLIALGRMKTVCAIAWARVLLLVALVVLVFPGTGARGVALCVLATAFGGFAALQILSRRALAGFGIREIVRQVWRPMIATTVMAGTVLAVSRTLGDSSIVMRLPVEVGAGVVTYAVTLVALWRSAGAPAGAETYLLDKLRGRFLP